MGGLCAAGVSLDAAQIAPMVTWGTSPDQGTTIDMSVPDPATENDATRKRSAIRALEYMGLQPGQQLDGLTISHAFIGEAPRITPARGPPLWNDCAAQETGEGVDAMPDW